MTACHSVELDLHYTPRMRGKRLYLRFEDGVEYSLDEANRLAQGAPVARARSRKEAYGSDLRAIHHIKKLFGGVIVGGPLPVMPAETTEESTARVNRAKTRPSVRQVKELEGWPQAVQQNLFNS